MQKCQWIWTACFTTNLWLKSALHKDRGQLRPNHTPSRIDSSASTLGRRPAITFQQVWIHLSPFPALSCWRTSKMCLLRWHWYIHEKYIETLTRWSGSTYSRLNESKWMNMNETMGSSRKTHNIKDRDKQVQRRLLLCGGTYLWGLSSCPLTDSA